MRTQYHELEGSLGAIFSSKLGNTLLSVRCDMIRGVQHQQNRERGGYISFKQFDGYCRINKHATIYTVFMLYLMSTKEHSFQR